MGKCTSGCAGDLSKTRLVLHISRNGSGKGGGREWNKIEVVFLPGKSENMNNAYTLPENIPWFPRNDRGRGFLAFHPPIRISCFSGEDLCAW